MLKLCTSHCYVCVRGSTKLGHGQGLRLGNNIRPGYKAIITHTTENMGVLNSSNLSVRHLSQTCCCCQRQYNTSKTQSKVDRRPLQTKLTFNFKPSILNLSTIYSQAQAHLGLGCTTACSYCSKGFSPAEEKNTSRANHENSSPNVDSSTIQDIASGISLNYTNSAECETESDSSDAITDAQNASIKEAKSDGTYLAEVTDEDGSVGPVTVSPTSVDQVKAAETALGRVRRDEASLDYVVPEPMAVGEVARPDMSVDRVERPVVAVEPAREEARSVSEVLEPHDDVAVVRAEETRVQVISAGEDDGSAKVPVIRMPVARRPAPRPAVHLAAYVNESDTLSRLVALGVDLSKVEKDRRAAEHLIKLEWAVDVQPYLDLLSSHHVRRDKLGDVMTRAPQLLRENMVDLQSRADYFYSKRFSASQVGRVLTRAPGVLLVATEEVDARLGRLQRQYGLKGVEVRDVITRLPKLITWDEDKLKYTRLQLQEFIGFSDLELREVMLKAPKIFITDKYKMEAIFTYVANEMDVSHEQVANFPNVLRSRLHVVKERHRYLRSLGRDQFDPLKPNYVSLRQMIACKDSDFASKVAGTSLKHYVEFLKTL